MSTHLEHGFEVEVTSLLGLQQLLDNFQGAVQPRALGLFAKAFAERIAESVDGEFTVPEGTPPLAAARQAIDEAVEDLDALRLRRERAPDLDVSLSLTLIPMSDGKVLGLIFTEQQALQDLWMQQPGVTPYPYWDHTDRPDDVSEEEWEARAARWEQALPSGVPALSGLTRTVVEVPSLYSAETQDAIVAHYPAFDDRLSRAARHYAIERRLTAIASESSDGPTSRVLDAVRWLDTPDGEAAVAAARQDLAGRLPKQLPNPWKAAREPQATPRRGERLR